MTEQELTDLFNETILPAIIAHYGADDKVAVRTAFNDWTDGLCKGGHITDDQYNNYCYLGTD